MLQEHHPFPAQTSNLFSGLSKDGNSLTQSHNMVTVDIGVAIAIGLTLF